MRNRFMFWFASVVGLTMLLTVLRIWGPSGLSAGSGVGDAEARGLKEAQASASSGDYLTRRTFALRPGWNFKAFAALPADTTIEGVLPPEVRSQVEIIFGFDNETKVWRFWKPWSWGRAPVPTPSPPMPPGWEDGGPGDHSDPGTWQRLDRFEFGCGYWFYMNGEARMDATDWETPSGMPPSLHAGWNLVGWSEESAETEKILGQHRGNWVSLWHWRHGEWFGLHAGRETEEPPIHIFRPGQAFWVEVRQMAPSLQADWDGSQQIAPAILVVSEDERWSSFPLLQEPSPTFVSVGSLQGSGRTSCGGFTPVAFEQNGEVYLFITCGEGSAEYAIHEVLPTGDLGAVVDSGELPDDFIPYVGDSAAVYTFGGQTYICLWSFFSWEVRKIAANGALGERVDHGEENWQYTQVIPFRDGERQYLGLYRPEEGTFSVREVWWDGKLGQETIPIHWHKHYTSVLLCQVGGRQFLFGQNKDNDDYSIREIQGATLASGDTQTGNWSGFWFAQIEMAGKPYLLNLMGVPGVPILSWSVRPLEEHGRLGEKTSEDAVQCDIIGQPLPIRIDLTYNQTNSWMTRRLKGDDAFKEARLSDIVIPGAHDAAMYTSQHCQLGGHECNTRTQNLHTYHQLEAGVRFFDLRPLYDPDGPDGVDIWTGHSTNEAGCLGGQAEDVCKAIGSWLDDTAHAEGPAELVILTWTHFQDRKFAGFPNSAKAKLEGYVKKHLGDYLVKLDDGTTTSRCFNRLTLGEILERGRVIAMFSRLSDGEHPEEGIYSTGALDIYNDFSDTETLGHMVSDQMDKLRDLDNHENGKVFLLSWTLTQSFMTASQCDDTNAFPTDSIFILAHRANSVIFGHLDGVRIDGQLVDYRPNILYTDIVGPFTARLAQWLNDHLYPYTHHVTTAVSGGNGTVAPASADIPHGERAIFTLQPSECWYVGSVEGCGGTLEGNVYTTDWVVEDCDISVRFDLRKYLVSVDLGGEGTVYPGKAEVFGFDTATFTFTPAENWSLGSVSGCGGTLNGNVYTTGPVTADCTIMAEFEPGVFTVSTAVEGEGTITPESAVVIKGGRTGFEVTPADGWWIRSVSGCGGQMVIDNIYETGEIVSNCTVTAQFTNTFRVSTAVEGEGTITPAAADVPEGGQARLTVTPADGWHIQSVDGCNGALDGNVYTTGPMTADCTVTATFAMDPHTVSTKVYGHVSVVPREAQVVHGDTAEFTLTLGEGWHIDWVRGCNGTLAGNVYTTGPVMEDCTVEVFADDTYGISTEVVGQGTITPASARILENDRKSFTLTPADFWHIQSVEGCGGTLDGNVYTTAPVTGDCKVTATFAIDTYTVSTWLSGRGALTPREVQVAHGDTAEFTITPGEGWHIAWVKGCEGTLAGNVYTTGPVTGDCTVEVFLDETYGISTEVVGQGTITPTSARMLENERKAFTLTPAEGWHIASVEGCGGTLDGNVYTTAPVTGDCKVTATFAINTYTVGATLAGSGTVTPQQMEVNYGDTAQFTFTPAEFWHIVSVEGCGGSLDGNVYTTAPVTADCTVTGRFAIDTHMVGTAVEGNGSVTPGQAEVPHGGTAPFTLTPAEGWHIASVEGCGGTLDGNVYTTAPVTGDCTVTATFAINTYTVGATVAGSGTVTPQQMGVNYGDTAQFTFTPAEFWHIVSVEGCGGSLDGNLYTTAPVTADCTVTGRFAIDTHMVSTVVTGPGSVTPEQAEVAHGERAQFTIMPNDVSTLTLVEGCGGSLDGNIYTTAAVTADCTIRVFFSSTLEVHTVRAVVRGEGSVTPSQSVVVHGEAAELTVTPAEGWRILWVWGCGGSLDGNVYRMGPVTSDCSVRVRFGRIWFPPVRGQTRMDRADFAAGEAAHSGP